MKKWIFIIGLIVTFYTNGIEFTKLSQFSLSEFYDANHTDLILDADYLFAINNRSLQIFDTCSQELEMISELNLEGILSNLVIKNNFAYVSIEDYDLKRIYRIDYTDIENPIVTDTLFFSDGQGTFVSNELVFVPEHISFSECIMHIYDNISFTEISQIDFHLYGAGNGYGINWNDDIYSIYDISDPDSISFISSDSISWGHSQLFDPKIIEDSYIIMNMADSIRIFDFTQNNNWQLLSSLDFGFGYDLWNNILFSYNEGSIRSYDIGEISNPILLLTLTTNSLTSFFSDLRIKENFVYTSTFQGEIRKYQYTASSLIYLTSFLNSGWLNGCHLYNNSVFITSLIGELEQYNIIDVYNPELTNSFSTNKLGCGINGSGNILISLKLHPENGEYSNVLYFINDSEELEHLHTFANLENFSSIMNYNCESDKYFFVTPITIHRYHLDEANELVEDYILNNPSNDEWLGVFYCYNNYAYVPKCDELTIIDNISEDMLIVNDINIQPIWEFPDIKFYGDYMFLSSTSPFEACYVYNISNPVLPVLICSIDNSGVIAIDEANELLFMGYFECEVYDLSNIEYGIISQIGSLRNWSICQSIIPFQRNNENFLIYFEDTSCSIYQYDYYPNQLNNETISLSPVLSNHPNPFNPSTEISFQISEVSEWESAEIVIYNIKGQKVKTLPVSSSQSHTFSLTWDGTDRNNRKVSSGVYLYQLQVDGKPLASRKMMLFK